MELSKSQKEVSVGGKTGWLNEGIWYVGCSECGAQGPELLTNEEDMEVE